MGVHMFGRCDLKHFSSFLAVVFTIWAGEIQIVSAIEPVDQSLVPPQEFQSRSLGKTVPVATAEKLSAALLGLYNAELGVDERLAAGEQVRTMLRDEVLKDLRSSVGRRVDLITAGLDAAAIESLSTQDLDAVNSILTAANRFEETCNATDADAVRVAWQQLSLNTSVMEILRPVFMTHYFNHNFHVTLSEPMLSRFVSDYRTRNGSIAECILGAWVTGSQVTSASVSADIRRSTEKGHFLLRLDGQTSSNTQGRKRPATIFTRGNHTFQINAPVYFDGESLRTGEAKIDVNTNNRTVRVKTDYDGWPILGPLARKIARQKAQEKRGQSEFIAAKKIASRALPEFNTEINERFSEANSSIQDELFAGLRAKGVGPDSISSRSSESHLAVSSRMMGTARLGGTGQPFAPLPALGVAIQVHETAINNLIDGLELGGRAIREDEFMDELSSSLSELFQRDIKLDDAGEVSEVTTDESAGSDTENPATFIFDEENPVRVRIEKNVIVLVLQLGIEQEGKDSLPKHRIEVPIGLGITGSEIVLLPPDKLTDIRTTAMERVSAIRRAGTANQIRRIIRARLPERKLDGGVDITASSTKTIRLQTIALSSQDGWLYVELQ
ncbi:MAG: hypothetical protein MK102_02435 [Fuerstiella sp.]|nr:hypothetical protein [Fuerstiella sp.]